jgi:hypothetical protein
VADILIKEQGKQIDEKFKIDIEAVKEKEGQEQILALLEDTNRDSSYSQEEKPFETALKNQIEELEMNKVDYKPSSPERYQKFSML